ncbi:MAG: alpha/beta fold hydrolase [Streptosporangiales bacterium]|nr:alpha/beta fold hydrolase [Streptosporangiales bacterium]
MRHSAYILQHTHNPYWRPGLLGREEGQGVLAELVSIPTDGNPLDGVLYQPAVLQHDRCVQFFHGNAMNFYVGPARFLPPALLTEGFACLAYNRRGHDTLSTRNSREPEGNAFQTVEQAIADNEYAAGWLEKRGYRAPGAIGHSNGGVLAAQHVTRHARTPALVLMSAHCGGQRLAAVASRHGLLARDRLDELTARARALVDDGKGDELLLLPGLWHVTSAASFLDLLTETPDLLQLAPEISCPTLFLRGDREPDELYPMEEFQRRSGGPCDIATTEGGDHFYNGVADTVVEVVTRWLRDVLPAAPTA